MPRKSSSKKDTEVQSAPDLVLLSLLILVSILSFFAIFLYVPPERNQNISKFIENSADSNTSIYSSFEEAYSAFTNSEFLMEKWGNACEFKINTPEELMFLAKLERKGDEYNISCMRGMAYDPIELSDVMYDWDFCSDTPSNSANLAKRVYDELHKRPYPLVHLTETLPEREQDLAFIFVTNCHYLHALEISEANERYCSENNLTECDVKSAVYGVLDAYTGMTYW